MTPDHTERAGVRAQPPLLVNFPAASVAGLFPPPSILHAVLRHERNSGKLFWRARDPGMFADGRYARQWNARLAGREALASINAHGYASGRIFGKNYLAHRVLWAMETCAWPKSQIDHINGIRSDNRLINLREVTSAQNARNQRKRCDNTSGVVGVSWDSVCAKWRAKIKTNGKIRYLGWFADIDDAAAARKIAEAQYGFHRNHGVARG